MAFGDAVYPNSTYVRQVRWLRLLVAVDLTKPLEKIAYVLYYPPVLDTGQNPRDFEGPVAGGRLEIKIGSVLWITPSPVLEQDVFLCKRRRFRD